MHVNSLMQLDRYFLRFLRIETRLPGGFQTPNAETDLEFSFNPQVRRRNGEPHFWVSFQLDLTWPKEAKSTFNAISIALDGFYSFPKKTDEETIKKYVPVLCFVSLYGIARGIVSQATGMCEDGPFILPLVDMNEVVRQGANKSSQDALAPKADKPRIGRKSKSKPHEN